MVLLLTQDWKKPSVCCWPSLLVTDWKTERATSLSSACLEVIQFACVPASHSHPSPVFFFDFVLRLPCCRFFDHHTLTENIDQTYITNSMLLLCGLYVGMCNVKKAQFGSRFLSWAPMLDCLCTILYIKFLHLFKETVLNIKHLKRFTY